MTEATELKYFLKQWPVLEKLSALVGRTCFPFLHRAWWFSTNSPIPTQG